MNTSDHIYVDLNAFNASTSNKNETLLLSERRNGSFLNDASQYYMTVARFYLENPRFPVIIPTVDLSQSGTPDVNKLIYEVSMEYFNTSTSATTLVSSRLSFVPDDLNVSVPTYSSLTTKDFTFNKYYWLYSYDSFLEILNKALKTCFALIPSSYYTTQNNTIPNVSVAMTDISTHQFVISAREEFDDSSPTTALNASTNKKLRLYFNSPLMALFSGFRSIITSDNRNRVRLYNTGDNFTTSRTVSGITYPGFIAMLTDIPSTNLWNPVQSIVFTSGTIPVSQNLIGANQVFNPPSGFEASGSNSNVSPIITDLQIPFEPTNTYRPYIYYTPSPYRLIDLISNSNLTDLSAEVFWKDRFGGIHPFELLPFCSVSLKLLFRHKSLGV
jgi:hypothetical protein